MKFNTHRLKFIFFFLGLLFFCDQALAQLSGVVFIGSISIKKGDYHFPYKIQFTDTNGTIKGYSVTDPQGPAETKSGIIGTINKNNKEITFKEISIVNTKSSEPRDSFCFIQAHLRVTTIKGSKALKGHFETYRTDGKTSCGTGNIILFSAADVIDKLMRIAEKIDTSKQKKIPKPDVKDENVMKVLPGKTTEISCNGSTATISVWDNEKIDGDIVTVKHNDTIILDHYMLLGTLKEMTFGLSSFADTITVIANSEGAEPPNTARMKIVSGTNTYYLDASTTIEQPVNIILKRKK